MNRTFPAVISCGFRGDLRRVDIVSRQLLKSIEAVYQLYTLFVSFVSNFQGQGGETVNNVSVSWNISQ
jgi:hypothetical protein